MNFIEFTDLMENFSYCIGELDQSAYEPLNYLSRCYHGHGDRYIYVCGAGQPEHCHYEFGPVQPEETNMYEQPSGISNTKSRDYEIPMSTCKRAREE